MKRKRWWWNGRWGRIARRDVMVLEHEGRWAVQVRAGGAEGRSRWLEVASEQAAVFEAGRAMAEQDGWRDMIPLMERDQAEREARRVELERSRAAPDVDGS